MTEWYPNSWNDVPEIFDERERVIMKPEPIGDCFDAVIAKAKSNCDRAAIVRERILGKIMDGLGENYSFGNLRAVDE